MSWRHADQCNLGWLPIPLCHWHKVVPKATVINFETWSCRNSRYYTELGNIPNVHGSPMRNRPMGENSFAPAVISSPGLPNIREDSSTQSTITFPGSFLSHCRR